MGSGDRRSSQTPPFHHDGSPSPSDREVSALSACDAFNVFELKLQHADVSCSLPQLILYFSTQSNVSVRYLPCVVLRLMHPQ